MLNTVYGLGLRAGELVNLKVNSIDSDRMIVRIENAKGKKDRLVMLPETLLVLLRKYFQLYMPKNYLFEGQNNQQYTLSSLRKVLAKSVDKAGIKKESITLHTLRHSFATHLMESGVNVRIIQRLLGHNNLNTTMLYTQVSTTSIQKVKSPLDLL